MTEYMAIEEGQSPEIHFYAAPGVVLHHPGEIGFQISDCEIVRTAVKESRNAPYRPGVAIDCFAAFALQFEGLQMLLIELVESLLFMVFHGEFPPRGMKEKTHP